MRKHLLKALGKLLRRMWLQRLALHYRLRLRRRSPGRQLVLAARYGRNDAVKFLAERSANIDTAKEPVAS